MFPSWWTPECWAPPTLPPALPQEAALCSLAWPAHNCLTPRRSQVQDRELPALGPLCPVLPLVAARPGAATLEGSLLLLCGRQMYKQGLSLVLCSDPTTVTLSPHLEGG